MRINKQVIGSSILLGGFLLFSQSALVHADEAKTDVTVLITEPELYIESVSAPTFGTYKTSDAEQTITSDSDLVINVVDKRENTGGWQLKYALSVFEQEESKKEQKNINYVISKGSLTDDQNDLSKNIAQIKEIDQASNGDYLVSLDKSEATNYQYLVAKKGIKLELPKNIATGKYSAVQTITLENMPSITD